MKVIFDRTIIIIVVIIIIIIAIIIVVIIIIIRAVVPALFGFYLTFPLTKTIWCQS